MKILVNVYIPAIGQRNDVLIPPALRIRTVASLIAGTAADLSDQRYVPSGAEHLCSVEKNILLRSNATLERYGIQNGDHLVLI